MASIHPTASVLTEVELRKLHAQFGLPSIDVRVNLLKKAEQDEMELSVRKTLEEIANRCTSCQTWIPRAARFLVSLPTETLVFNYEIEVDAMQMDGAHVLHIIDRYTRYSVAGCMTNQTAEHMRDGPQRILRYHSPRPRKTF